ncbi:MAG: hypothetical protein IPK82_33630 [Polyangiaceae bacterium]|nr:hypothetical protein [Polyangiaceae bacterium]
MIGLLRNVLCVAAACGVVALVSCGPASPEPTNPTSVGSTQPTSEPVQTSTPATPAATAAPQPSAAPSAPPKPGVPYDSVPVPGTQPLTQDEAVELKSKCKKLSEAVAAQAKKNGSSKRPIDAVFEVIANPPKIAGVDVPRCADLMKRDTVSYLGQSRENEAKMNLRRVMVGLMGAIEKDPQKFCPSASAVPPSLDAVKTSPYSSKPEDWQSEGWKCVRLDLSGAPQVFQYELVTNVSEKTYTVIARGYPVQGGPSTELYIEGKVDHGAVDPSTPILRR